MKYLSRINFVVVGCIIFLLPVNTSFADKIRGSLSLNIGHGIGLHVGNRHGGIRYNHQGRRHQGRYRHNYGRNRLNHQSNRYSHGRRHNNPRPHNYSRHNYTRHRGCHQTSKIGYRHGRKAKIGGTMCYNRYGKGYIVSGSHHVIRYY